MSCLTLNPDAFQVGGMESHPQVSPSPRNRLKGRLGAKSGLSPSQLHAPQQISSSLRNARNALGHQGNIGDLNRRITDLKMEGVARQTSLADLQMRLQPLSEPRRDSNSTVSTYYGSMRSTEFGSRRSSQASGVSAIRAGFVGAGSFYDPISPGTSRRSSQLSTASGRINPTAHFPGQYNTNNLVVQTQNMSLQVSPSEFCYMLQRRCFVLHSCSFNKATATRPTRIIRFRTPEGQPLRTGPCPSSKEPVTAGCPNRPVVTNKANESHPQCHPGLAPLNFRNSTPTRKFASTKSAKLKWWKTSSRSSRMTCSST